MIPNSHTIGKLAAPIPAAIFFGWVIYEATITRGIPLPLGIMGAIGASVAVEAVGMSAGKDAIRFTVAGHWLAVPSWLSLFAYTAVGMYELSDTVFAVAFLFSFLAYVNDGIGAIWERNTAAKADVRADMKEARAAELAAQAARDSEAARLAHDLKLAELAAKERYQMAKLAPQKAQIVELAPQIVELAPQVTELAPRAIRRNELTAQDKVRIAAMTTAEVQEHYGVRSERTAQDWIASFSLTATSDNVRAD